MPLSRTAPTRPWCNPTTPALPNRTTGLDGLGGTSSSVQVQQRMRAAVCRRLEAVCGVMATSVNTVFAMPVIVDAMVSASRAAPVVVVRWW